MVLIAKEKLNSGTNNYALNEVFVVFYSPMSYEHTDNKGKVEVRQVFQNDVFHFFGKTACKGKGTTGHILMHVLIRSLITIRFSLEIVEDLEM